MFGIEKLNREVGQLSISNFVWLIASFAVSTITPKINYMCTNSTSNLLKSLTQTLITWPDPCSTTTSNVKFHNNMDNSIVRRSYAVWTLHHVLDCIMQLYAVPCTKWTILFIISLQIVFRYLTRFTKLSFCTWNTWNWKYIRIKIC